MTSSHRYRLWKHLVYMRDDISSLFSCIFLRFFSYLPDMIECEISFLGPKNRQQAPHGCWTTEVGKPVHGESYVTP